jgi:hypothetical protein
MHDSWPSLRSELLPPSKYLKPSVQGLAKQTAQGQYYTRQYASNCRCKVLASDSPAGVILAQIVSRNGTRTWHVRQKAGEHVDRERLLHASFIAGRRSRAVTAARQNRRRHTAHAPRYYACSSGDEVDNPHWHIHGQRQRHGTTHSGWLMPHSPPSLFRFLAPTTLGSVPGGQYHCRRWKQHRTTSSHRTSVTSLQLALQRRA